MSPQNSGESFLIRADAGSQMGTGHVMRCLALAQVLYDMGARITFMTAQGNPGLEAHLRSEGMNVEKLSVRQGSVDDAIETRNLAKDAGAKWIVIDGYHFDSEYQRIIKDSGLHLLLIDDVGHAGNCWADIVLNQNIYAHEGLYVNRERYTRLLLGTRYVLLRREFFEWRGWRREIPEVAGKVLVTLGGSDPDNVTLKVLNALERVDISDLEVKIVVGPSNPNTQTLENALLFAPCSMRILHNVMDMPELMAWADVALSAGGSTCWELAFMGLPALVISVANNQHPVAEWFDAIGVATNLGGQENLSSDEIAQALSRLLLATGDRTQMSQRAKNLVDSEGASRVLMYLKGREPRLRQVCEDDCKLLWDWANDSQAREVSFSSEPVSWEQHVRWLKSKLNDPNCIFYIVTNEQGIPIGQVRYDLYGSEAVISVSIHRRFRGQGYGSRTILLSSQKVFDASDVRIIHAYAKEGNKASTRAFLKAGFKKTGTKIIDGHRAIDFVLIRDTTVWTAISR